MIPSGGEGRQAKDLRCCEQKRHSNQDTRLKWDHQNHRDVNKEVLVPQSCEGMSYSLHGESAHLSALWNACTLMHTVWEANKELEVFVQFQENDLFKTMETWCYRSHNRVPQNTNTGPLRTTGWESKRELSYVWETSWNSWSSTLWWVMSWELLCWKLVGRSTWIAPKRKGVIEIFVRQHEEGSYSQSLVLMPDMSLWHLLERQHSKPKANYKVSQLPWQQLSDTGDPGINKEWCTWYLQTGKKWPGMWNSETSFEGSNHG